MTDGTAATSTGARRRGRPGYDLATLLPVAVELFNERGYDGTSMRDLAARLGIAKSAIYHHVAGKEELLSLALDRALGGLSVVVSRARALPAPGHRAAGVPGPRQRRGAPGRVALRHPAAAGARQHRRRAGRARAAARLRPVRGRTGGRGRAGRRHPARCRRDAHRTAAVRPGQLHRRVVQAGPRRGLAGRPGVRDGLRRAARQAPASGGFSSGSRSRGPGRPAAACRAGPRPGRRRCARRSRPRRPRPGCP